ncbi:hypothetical protein HanPI659440_Chr12g0472431 [Helianthus annuus]|nr:hypothetical protein HanPI659440_Chr12g0472431 [Helianthus annuus]
MFLYVNMFSIFSDMSDMFCTRLIMLPIMFRVMLPIMFSICSDMCDMFSIRLCSILVMSVLTQCLF